MSVALRDASRRDRWANVKVLVQPFSTEGPHFVFFFLSFFMLLFSQAGLVDWIATSFQSRHIKEWWLFFFIFSPPPLLLSIPIICSKHLPISIRWEEAYSLIAHPIWFLPSSSSLLCSLKSLFYFIFFLSSSSSFFPKNFYTYSIPLSLFFSLLFSLVEQHVSISKRPGSKMRKYTKLDWKVSLWFVNLHFFVFFRLLLLFHLLWW